MHKSSSPISRRHSLPRLLVLLCAIFVVRAAPVVAQPARSPSTDGSGADGFRPIFDGKSLAGWEGDPKYWRIENGCLVGEVTPETLLQRNSFVIWRGGAVEDFDLKVSYRVSSQGNSGVNYRSEELPGLPWAMRGPQADIDGEIPGGKRKVRHTGQIYEERGRAFLALRGQIVRVENEKAPLILGSLGTPEDLASVIKNGDWNEYHVIARGGVLLHLLNGRLVSVVVDDATARPKSGLIGVQVHVGPPMKIEYRNIRLRTL